MKVDLQIIPARRGSGLETSGIDLRDVSKHTEREWIAADIGDAMRIPEVTEPEPTTSGCDQHRDPNAHRFSFYSS